LQIYHPEGELPVARVAGELGIPYSLSTAGSVPIEEAAAHNVQGAAKGIESQSGATDPNGLRWFQLYIPNDDELCISFLQRAHDSGWEAAVCTLDTPMLAWRHQDVAIGAYAPYKGVTGHEIGLSDKVFQRRLAALGIDPVKDPKAAGRKYIDTVWHGHTFDWERVKWAKEQWHRISGNKPFLVKGIQSVEDAKKSLEIGCQGIVVSNHAGRQVDGAVGSLEVLPEIVDAVGDKLVVCFDSGVRGGSDVFKALALGAKLVMIGRLWIFGLSIGGEQGVRHVLKSLLAEFDILMNVGGFRSIKEIDRSALRHKKELGPRL
jgi:isopentenyl diphosphate isomerase/L-lactate dehydrogenase-like FMN-dependent dehydrogenase